MTKAEACEIHDRIHRLQAHMNEEAEKITRHGPHTRDMCSLADQLTHTFAYAYASGVLGCEEERR